MMKAFSKAVSDGKLMAPEIRVNSNVLPKYSLDVAYAKKSDRQIDIPRLHGRNLGLRTKSDAAKGLTTKI
jgi:hypothetical protein